MQCSGAGSPVRVTAHHQHEPGVLPDERLRDSANEAPVRPCDVVAGAPRHARMLPVQQPVEHDAVAMVRVPPAAQRREQGREHGPLGIGELVTADGRRHRSPASSPGLTGRAPHTLRRPLANTRYRLLLSSVERREGQAMTPRDRTCSWWLPDCHATGDQGIVASASR